MTDKEIIKALECLTGESIPCKDCSYSADYTHFDCQRQVAKDALDLINRQMAEYNNLLEQFRILDCECERLEKTDENQKAEIERLPVLRDKAIKDFIEFTQRAYIDNPFACQYCVHSVGDGRACLWKEEHEKDGESCLGKQFKYDLQKMVGKGL